LSKLADLLKQASQAYTRPIGFGAMTARSTPLPMVLIAEVDSAAAAGVEAAIAAGAQAVLAPAAGTAAVTAAKAAVAKGTLGATLDDGTKDDVARLEKDGCEFVVLRSTGLPADVLTADSLEKLLEVDASWPDALIRGVEVLPLAGIVYRIPAGEPLTIQQLLLCRRVAGLAGKPLFVAVPAGLGGAAAQPLRAAGAVGLLVPAAAAGEFRDAIKALPVPKRQKENIEATLPTGFMSRAKESEHDDDDDGDGDDD